MDTKEKTLDEKWLLALQNMQDPIKNTSAHKHKYSNLPQIIGIIRPALQAQGLDFAQRSMNYIDGEKQNYVLETKIFDDKSEVVLDRRPLCFTSDAQKSGSYETYMRRYALLTVFGLAPKDEDDNGYRTTREGSQKAQNTQAKPKAQPEAQAEALTADEELFNLAAERTKTAITAGIKKDGIVNYMKSTFATNEQMATLDPDNFAPANLRILSTQELNTYVSHLNQLISDKQALQEA